MRLKYQVAVAGVTTGCVCLSILSEFLFGEANKEPLFGLVLRTLVGIVTFLVSAVLFDIYRFGPADSLTYRGLIVAYLNVRKTIYFGSKLYERDQKATTSANQTQIELIRDMLADGGKTKLGKDLGLDKIDNITKFRNDLPLSTYENVRSYVDRAIDGEENVLFKKPILYVGTTSGTTGKSKKYPKNSDYFEILTNELNQKSFYVIFEKFPSVALKKTCSLQTYHRPVEIGAGFHKGPVSATMLSYDPRMSIPEEAVKIEDEDASQYIALLFSMTEREIGMIKSFFTSPALVFFQKMESSWEDLCSDIEHGTIQSGYKISDSMLNSLRQKFQSNPERADELRREFCKGFTGIAKRIWPDLKLSVMLSSGVFQSSAEILGRIYLKDVPNYSRVHGGTESGYGFNCSGLAINPEYYLLVYSTFFELLPADEETESTILPQEAEIGKRYEMIITTREGLYRYRTTDVIEVTGFDGQLLKYKFSQRAGDVLCLLNEKSPVHVIETALFATFENRTSTDSLINFTCTEGVNVNRVKGEAAGELCYWVFMETKFQEPVVTQEFSDKLEKCMADVLDSYRRLRTHETIKPVKIVQVAQGTFDKLRSHTLKTKPTTSVDQYKPPRLVRSDDLIQILLDNII